MKKKFIYIVAILIFSRFGLYSQTSLSGYSYLLNPYLINSAYAGWDEGLNTSFQYLQTSASFTGAPKMFNLAVASPVYKNMSMGGRIYNQSEGLFRNLSGYLDYAYKLKISSNQYLGFGINTGIQFRQLSYSEIIAEDPSAIIDVASRSYEGVSFLAGAGIAYQYQKLGFGFSIPDLFETKISQGTDIQILLNYTMSALDGDVNLKPSLFFNYNPNSPLSYDFSLLTYYKKQYFMGLAYRNSPGMYISAGFKVKNLTLSYGISMSLKKESNILNQMHEVSLSYTFKKLRDSEIDTISKPEKDILVKIDSVKFSVDTSVFISDQETDSIQKPDETGNKPLFVIQEAGKGVYAIKQINPDSAGNIKGNFKYITADQMQKLDQDSLIASQIMLDIEKSRQDKNYEIVEVGDGLYSLRWKEGNTNPEINENVIDSVLLSDLPISGLGNEKKNIKNRDFYTIELKIDENNKSVLLDAEIALQTWFETDFDGNFRYYYGKFPLYDDAMKALSDLRKSKEVNAEILKL